MTLYLIFCLLLLASLAVVLTPLFKADLPEKQRRVFILGTGAFFFAAAFGLYFLWGAPSIIPLLTARQQKLAELRIAISHNSEEVRAAPKNLKAWLELGQEFMEAGQYSAAVNALRESVVLSQGDPKIILAYAQAQIFAAGGTVNPDAEKALQMVLIQQPQNPEARYYLIVRQLQQGRTQEAMKEMKALYQSLPPDSPVKKMIDEEIGKE